MECSINQNWRFFLGDVPDAWKKDYDDSGWRPVTLPHDWAVEGEFSREYSSGTGYLPGGRGWYRGSFNLPENARGKKITLLFDGVYKNSRVWCNSSFLGMRPNGYIGFSYDISHCARFGQEENVITVSVTHEDISDSRWFTGSGMTRGVMVRVEDKLHFAENGVVFRCIQGDSQRVDIEIEARVENEWEDAKVFSMRHTLLDGENVPVWQQSREMELRMGGDGILSFPGQVNQPKLWSAGDPYLYTLCSELLCNGEVIGQRQMHVGIRTFRFDPDRGFLINGNHEILKGVCVHHDAGCLGAAVCKPVWKRRLTALKEMGCNAIRMSHNPHMPELFQLCDEMGFYAIDEAFDEWEGCKNKWSTGHNVYPPKHQGYATDFPQWGETDLRALVRRDRNHPSIIAWSIGNEVDYPNDPYCHPLLKTATGNNDANKPLQEMIYNPDRPNMERLAVLAARLAEIVHQEDSSRPVTAALAFPEISSHIGCIEPLDVVGYNYKEQFYEQDHRRFPEKPFLGSENGKSLEAWKAVLDHDYIAGQFLWTGYDFLGEAEGWPVHGSEAGLLTTAGFPKGEYWFRRALWAEQAVLTLITARTGETVFSRSWTYSPSQEITVRCCTNLPEAELFLNGRSLGKKKRSPETWDIRWQVPFEEGTLTVRGGSMGDTLVTTGAPVSLDIRAWDESITANGEDIAQIEITLTDSHGRQTSGEEMLSIGVDGAAVLLGLESGDQSDNTAYSEPRRKTYGGKLIAYLRTKTTPGPIHITVHGSYVGSHTMTLSTE